MDLGYDVDFVLPTNGIFFMAGHNEIKSFSIDGITPNWYSEIRKCSHSSGFVFGAQKGQRVKMITNKHKVLFFPIK